MVDFSVVEDLVGKEVLSANGNRYICETVNPIKHFLGVALIKVLPGKFSPLYSDLGFEVWLLRSETRSGLYGVRRAVRFPSNEEFGRYGWGFNERVNAKKKFMELINNE